MVDPNKSKVKTIWKQHGKKPYAMLHTHLIPMNSLKDYFVAVHSPDDIEDFLKDEKEKIEFKAQKNKNTQKVEGYVAMRKTKTTPTFAEEFRLNNS